MLDYSDNVSTLSLKLACPLAINAFQHEPSGMEGGGLLKALTLYWSVACRDVPDMVVSAGLLWVLQPLGACTLYRIRSLVFLKDRRLNSKSFTQA